VQVACAARSDAPDPDDARVRAPAQRALEDAFIRHARSDDDPLCLIALMRRAPARRYAAMPAAKAQRTASALFDMRSRRYGVLLTVDVMRRRHHGARRAVTR